jgi:hypothetical protein
MLKNHTIVQCAQKVAHWLAVAEAPHYSHAVSSPPRPPPPPRPAGPGLAKARPRPFQERTATLVRGVDGAIATALKNADPCTEGAAAKGLDGEDAWFGSTSFLLPVSGSTEHLARWATWAGADVHVRLRALRVALGEASVRAPGPLGTAKCEVRVAPTATGLRIDVDVEAPLLGPGRAGVKSRTGRR